jgi:hypothetical protein
VIPISEQASAQTLSGTHDAVKPIVLIQTYLQPSYQSVEIVLGYTGPPLLGVSNPLPIN